MKKRSIIWLFLLIPCFVHAYKADLVIFSFDRPLQLWSLLESIERNVTNLGRVTVIYRASSQDFLVGYDEVETNFEWAVFKCQSDRSKQDFKPITMRSVAESPHEHIFFAVDDIVVTERIDLDECVRAMEEQDAYGFYLRMGLHLSACYSMKSPQRVPDGAIHKDTFFVWRLKDGQYDWNYPHSVDMTIFRKRDVLSQLDRLRFTSPNTLEGAWSARAGHVLSRLGICYVKAPTVNLPLNRVQNDWQNRHMNLISVKELLSLFQAGLKLNIEPLQGFVNDAAHIEYTPTFAPR